jgi:hypothetical protein
MDRGSNLSLKKKKMSQVQKKKKKLAIKLECLTTRKMPSHNTTSSGVPW